ncbi:hypothetical protein FXF51_40855 [Nonomuraea sp. PA05]|uniref:hypothetical protein n=1 Tax=Nonomuraea sp. PA05 TaxID=2604466 RepID=UPI0011D69804|nr:hypothetical protein [Nonomuraea sp. PA05]TYB57186.1 hypothetical protein FXF51_40855 [Nonomuraea sp. PA05]
MSTHEPHWENGPARPGPGGPPRPAGAFVARIKAGTVARKGRGGCLIWALTICVGLVLWLTSSDDEGVVHSLLSSGGSVVMGVLAYGLLALIVVAALLALHALGMFLFELARPRYLRISADGVELVRGLRRVRFAWPRIGFIGIVPGTGPKPRATLILRPMFDFTAPDPFAGQRLSWTTARSPWRDKATDTIGLCLLDELVTTPGQLDAALRHFFPGPRQW